MTYQAIMRTQKLDVKSSECVQTQPMIPRKALDFCVQTELCSIKVNFGRLLV